MPVSVQHDISDDQNPPPIEGGDTHLHGSISPASLGESADNSTGISCHNHGHFRTRIDPPEGACLK
jgi:hypothetical protein